MAQENLQALYSKTFGQIHCSLETKSVCSGQPLVISLNIQYALIHCTLLTSICVGCSHTRLSRIAGSALSLLARSAPLPTGLPGEAWAALI